MNTTPETSAEAAREDGITPESVFGLRRAPIASGAYAPRRRSLSALCLRLLGWSSDYDGLPAARGIYVVYPHTSNWDFPIGLLYKWHTRIPFRFWIKDSALRIPLIGRWIRWVGGVGLDRSAPQGVVMETMRQMRDADFFWLVIAPEGTRKRTEGWRTGFYHLWQASGCPVGLAYIDYAHKRVGTRDFVLCSGDMQADFAALARYYENRQGLRPAQAAPVRPLSRRP